MLPDPLAPQEAFAHVALGTDSIIDIAPGLCLWAAGILTIIKHSMDQLNRAVPTRLSSTPLTIALEAEIACCTSLIFTFRMNLPLRIATAISRSAGQPRKNRRRSPLTGSDRFLRLDLGSIHKTGRSQSSLLRLCILLIFVNAKVSSLEDRATGEHTAAVGGDTHYQPRHNWQ